MWYNVDKGPAMKRRIVSIFILLLFLLAMPLALAGVGFGLPAQYSKTYYAELPRLFGKLKETEGKKIVVIGNSGVAFGLDPYLVEREVDGYAVCPFGLYGAIGTKAMMDLSRVNIGEGDIVLLAPEQTRQSLSLYFNSEYVWNAVDGNYGLLRYLRNPGEMVGGFPGFASRKFGYFTQGNAPDPTDVYAVSSFDKNGKMTYDRPYNLLPLGYDGVSRISYDPAVFSPDFAEYVNAFNRFVTGRGATLYFAFAPVNASGIAVGTTSEGIDAYYDAVDALLDCPILGDPHRYIFESDWFYDSNVHMNSAGSEVYTAQLIRDIKVAVGDPTAVEIVLPEKPQRPAGEEPDDDGPDAAFFTYEESGDGWNITGLTENGRTMSVIRIPDFYHGKKVLSFDETVFAGNDRLEELRLGKYIYGIADRSFDGCINLKRLYVCPDNEPSRCVVYFALLDGAPQCRIYVPKERASAYANDYFWSRYGAYLEEY